MWYGWVNGWVEKVNDFDEVINESTKEENKPMNKPNNKAPKEMEGTYTLTIEGNKIKLSDKEGNVGMARCHPDDEFSLTAGVKKAFAKLKEEQEKIDIGDMVEIVNPDNGALPGFTSCFKNPRAQKYAPYFRYGVVPVKGTIGQIVYVNNDQDIYLVQEKESPCYGESKYNLLTYSCGVYIANSKGIRKVVKQ